MKTTGDNLIEALGRLKVIPRDGDAGEPAPSLSSQAQLRRIHQRNRRLYRAFVLGCLLLCALILLAMLWAPSALRI